MTEPRTMDRAEILARLADVNARAKEISRRGLTATRDNETYADLHANVDYLLACLAAACE